MALKIACSKCNARLQVREELAGKKVKCPKCTAVVPVPLPETVEEVEQTPEVEEVQEKPAARIKRKEDVAATPRGRIQRKEDLEPPARSRKHAEPEDEEENLEDSDDSETKSSRSKKGKKSKADKGSTKWAPCPRCGETRAKKVLYTFWGSAIGPAIFSHVRCQECGMGYNGRTGKSNLIAAILCITIALAAIIGLLYMIVTILHHRGHKMPWSS